ncbi:MAG: glutamate racemase [Ruminococcaceae bacterium]|nr:glutamate racemase [Oscillospiraceae bacterium]
MDSRAIGIFDSGFGGLTAAREVMSLAPTEDIVFFGDNARIPYGTKTASIITKYSLQDISFLLSQDVKLIIAACGTVSSTLSEEYAKRVPVPYITVVEPTARAAARATKNKKIGILGTHATVRSGAFKNALLRLDGEVETVSVACPLFVPLVENGYIQRDCEITRLAAAEYLAPLMAAGVDTVILGCTHYPLIKDIISDLMGENVTLIDSGYETAKFALELLSENGLENTNGGARHFFTSDNAEDFSSLGGLFMGGALCGGADTVAIESVPVNPLLIK